MNYLELAKVAAKAATEKKGKRIVLLDLKNMSDLCEYQLICSAENERQTGAIASFIEDSVRTTLGIKPATTEGKSSGHWILLDYGSVNIHIFYDYLRDYYALEEIWPQATTINLQEG